MGEQWRDVPEFPGYSVSDQGRVRGKLGTILKPWSNGVGYVVVGLCRDGRRAAVPTVHRLVLTTFEGLREGLQVAHLNGVKSDNRLVNLTWATASENMMHKRGHGTAPVGERHHWSRLTEADVRDIRTRVAAGETQRSLAREYGTHFANISAIVLRKSWEHVV